MKQTLLTLAFISISIISRGQTAWKPNPKYIAKHEICSDTANKVQCFGTTKKGERCKMKGKPNPDLIPNTYLCRYHINQQ